MYRRYNSNANYGDEFQVDIPRENVRAIEINRAMSLVLHTAIDTAACVKSINPDIRVKLGMSCESFDQNIDSIGISEAFTDDLIDEL